MRNLFEFTTDFPRMPEQNPYDEESGLYLNPKHQWSQSPYLGAVKSKNKTGYDAQIHIPQEVWERVIRDNPAKWNALGDSYFSENGKGRSTLRIAAKDPRQAAWLVQTVLYGPYDTNELIDDYLTAKINGRKGITAWVHLLEDMPRFDGAPLESLDHDDWFENHSEREKQNKLQRNVDAFMAKAPEKIKSAILDAVAKSSSLRKKVFGTSNLTLNQLAPVIDRAILELGTQYFLNGIKVKDPAQFDLSNFVKTKEFKEGFIRGFALKEMANPYKVGTNRWVNYATGYLSGTQKAI